MASARSQRVLVALLGLIGSAVFVALALRSLDFRAVRATLSNARPMPFLPLAVLAYLTGHFVRGQRLRVLVREAILPLPTASNVVVVGYASNNVFPARLGEFVRAGMLAERTGIPLSQALVVTLIERLFDGIAILVLLLAGTLALAVRAGWILGVARAGVLVFGVALALVVSAVLSPSALLATTSRLSTRLSTRARDRILALATSVTNAGASLRRPRDVIEISALSLIIWFFESLMFAFVLPVVGLKLELAPAVIAMSVTNLGILVPSSPGFVGSFHFFCSQALAALGVPIATAIGAALIVHLAFFVPVTLWGAAAILWYGVQVGATAAMTRAARNSPRVETVAGVSVHVVARLGPPPPSRAPSGFDVALTEAVLTSKGSVLDQAVLMEVATFVAQEMDALPPRLRLLYRAGMAAFRLSVRVRHLRSFCALDVERRGLAIQAWAFGPIGVFRQLFRPVRSIALLAYYEREMASVALAPSPALGSRFPTTTARVVAIRPESR
jgi:uncharacterized protein (TIRG00374 family)